MVDFLSTLMAEEGFSPQNYRNIDKPKVGKQVTVIKTEQGKSE